MDLIIYTLKSVAVAIVEPLHLLMLIIIGVMFYLKNRRISIIQKMTIGESLDSPLELTLSQIVIGIMAGAIGSLILMILGINFHENSGIEFVFMISILMLFYRPRFVEFAYSATILAIISFVSKGLNMLFNIPEFVKVDILTIMTFIGVIYIIQGILVMIDGSRGAIPVFTNKGNKIIGGFSLNRYWALPIAIFMIFSGQIYSGMAEMSIPNWWPLMNQANILAVLESAMLACIPFYGVMGYKAVTFTKNKKQKARLSGALILAYGISIMIISQLSRLGIIGQIITVVFVPVAYELLIKYDSKSEVGKEYLYVSDEEGIIILEVAPSSPAFLAGIRRGDKIISINDEKIESETEIFKMLRENIFKMKIRIKRNAGEIIECLVQPKNRRLGILLVPKMVKKEDILGVGQDDLKRILEELREKK